VGGERTFPIERGLQSDPHPLTCAASTPQPLPAVTYLHGRIYYSWVRPPEKRRGRDPPLSAPGPNLVSSLVSKCDDFNGFCRLVRLLKSLPSAYGVSLRQARRSARRCSSTGIMFLEASVLVLPTCCRTMERLGWSCPVSKSMSSHVIPPNSPRRNPVPNPRKIITLSLRLSTSKIRRDKSETSINSGTNRRSPRWRTADLSTRIGWRA